MDIVLQRLYEAEKAAAECVAMLESAKALNSGYIHPEKTILEAANALTLVRTAIIDHTRFLKATLEASGHLVQRARDSQ